jgi:hypothetical protein
MDAMINGVSNPLLAATSATRMNKRDVEQARPPEGLSNSMDTVDFSDAARERIEHGESGLIRRDLVERVRSEVAADTYLTGDKLDAAIDRLFDSLFSAA